MCVCVCVCVGGLEAGSKKVAEGREDAESEDGELGLVVTEFGQWSGSLGTK